MADILSSEQRSERMRRVRQKDTALEILVRKELHRRGFRYRLGGRGLPGRPDIVLPKHRAVVFVHGCFWHAHECQLGRRPTSNSRFWQQKALANKARDALVWQCEIASHDSNLWCDQLAHALFST